MFCCWGMFLQAWIDICFLRLNCISQTADLQIFCIRAKIVFNVPSLNQCCQILQDAPRELRCALEPGLAWADHAGTSRRGMRSMYTCCLVGCSSESADVLHGGRADKRRIVPRTQLAIPLNQLDAKEAQKPDVTFALRLHVELLHLLT